MVGLYSFTRSIYRENEVRVLLRCKAQTYFEFFYSVVNSDFEMCWAQGV